MNFILDKHKQLKQDFLRLEAEENQQQVLEFYERVIAKLNKELNKIPIGYRYTGVFCIIKSYTFPPAYEQISGSGFMREDLSSWAIENEARFKFSYHREIFRKGNDTTPITRDDAVPVFSAIINIE